MKPEQVSKTFVINRNHYNSPIEQISSGNSTSQCEITNLVTNQNYIVGYICSSWKNSSIRKETHKDEEYVFQTSMHKHSMKKLISDVCTKTVLCFNNRIFKEIDGVSVQSSAKYFEKNQEIKQNYARLKNVDTCFCIFLRTSVKRFRRDFFACFRECWTLSCLSITFWDFPNVFFFYNILSLKFSGRFWCDLNVKKTDLVIDTIFPFTCGESNLTF